MIWGRSVTLVNVGGPQTFRSIRFTSKILATDEPPRRGDTVVDLDGACVLPGLINAHDHLELNHFGRLKFRERYENAAEWIDDMRPQLANDPAIAAARRHSLTERLFIGALKNLLAGVTTVAHHNPYYSELRRTIPIRVIRRYGWAHSFAMEGQPAGARGEPGGEVAQRWRRTSADVPFMVHLAEGVDEDAEGELARLDAAGCLGPNTVIVHGVAIDPEGLRRLGATGASLVWCPASNMFLFGRTAAIRFLLERPGDGAVALGSDSRLTGANDLLDELREARRTGCASPSELLAMVTTSAARVLKLKHAGQLAIGSPADLIVVPNRADSLGESLLEARRADVGLVVVGGRPMVGEPRFQPVFDSRRVTTRPIVVDGQPRLAESALARRIAGCPITEPGVAVR